MPAPTDSGPLALDRPDDVSGVRDVLDRAGFDDRRVCDRLVVGNADELRLDPLDRPQVMRRTRDGDPLATLIRLFVAVEPISLADFRRAVEPIGPAIRAGLGLVELDGDRGQRRVRLWMGVPVVTCPEDPFAGRLSLSHLTNAGLTDSLARDLSDYMETAVALAQDLSRPAALWAGIRPRMASSPFCDADRFVRNLLEALRTAWREWCTALSS